MKCKTSGLQILVPVSNSFLAVLYKKDKLLNVFVYNWPDKTPTLWNQCLI